ncbi:universal stress protein [Pseudogulbenkiania subflava]|uniref:Nucleotide-binding universal stress protein, UspA family n=1 Tax=Pseudogulbenkiania subflava DSM 22618 TaxID=1123014 RepID=A0A1Y6BGE3_9NEIS|nr:universal stress protein [Pseudogulbenkiania subflava]SMF09827.1 Nucleotide-binding universal stress protein, UspA family [Pseudogulbenkiania subflava DSM 22618]
MTMRILVALDGSEPSLRAIDYLLRLHAAAGDLDVHLLNVQIPLESGHVRMFISHEDLQEYYREQGQAALKAGRERLEQAGIACTSHVAVGHSAQTITQFARERGIDTIVMGSHGHSGIGHLLLGSVTSEVIRLADIPVTVAK